MKQYIKPKSYKLGLNIYDDINYYYNLNNKRHGFYYSLYNLNIIYSYKGYYNMDMEYSHWKGNYQQSFFKYYL